MRKLTFYLLITIMTTSCIDKKLTFEQIFRGKIADKYPITMALISKDNLLSGNYIYDKSGIPIKIKGSIVNDSIFINGYDQKLKHIDKFKGIINNYSIKGIWSNPKGNNPNSFQLNSTILKFDLNLAKLIIPEKKQKQKQKQKYKDNNFPIIEFMEVNFEDNIAHYRGEGASLRITLKMKNNTPNIIRNFELKYYLKLKWKDGKHEYCPSNFFGNKDDDADRFTDLSHLKYYNLPIKTVWNPNENKIIELIIPKSSISGFNYNILNSKFERTPSKAYVGYEYVATSIDNEYKNSEFYDVLKYWISYQRKIGLRK